MSRLTRRELLRLAAGTTAYAATQGLVACASGPGAQPQSSPRVGPISGSLDYGRAKATPTRPAASRRM